MNAYAPLANWNGNETLLEDLMVPALDRAFFFGDGVYEAIRVYAGKPFLLEQHFARLAVSLEAIQIETDLGRLKQRTLQTLVNSQIQSALIYIQVTRGTAKRTHCFPKPLSSPNVLITVQQMPLDKYEGMRGCGVKVVTTEDIRWKRCDIKSLNLLPNCLAQEAAKKAGSEEALFVRDGFITEGTHTNVFGIIDGVLRTAPLSSNILAGITRWWVLKQAGENNLIVREDPIHTDHISQLSEMFLTGTTTEILGINMIDGIQIGGSSGRFTKKLFDLYQNDKISNV